MRPRISVRDLPAEETWLVRKQEMLTFLRDKADRNARILALADKLSNLRAIERDVTSIGDQVWERFHQKRQEDAWLALSSDSRSFAGIGRISGLEGI